MNPSVTAVLSGLLLLSGCNPWLAEERVQVDARTTVQPSDVGAGLPVSLQVVDGRTTKEIGRRHSSSQFESGPLNSSNDVAEAFSVAIGHGLLTKGFKPLPYDEAAKRQLKVEVRTLQFSLAEAGLQAVFRTSAVLKVSATALGGEYENTYRGDTEEAGYFNKLGAEPDGMRISAAAQGAVAKLLSDGALLALLAKQ